MSKSTETPGKSSGILEWIERIGNKLPDPVLLFVIFAAVIIVISWAGAMLGWSAVNPGDGSVVTVFSLISRQGIVKIFTEFSSNIKSFSALTDQMVVTFFTAAPVLVLVWAYVMYRISCGIFQKKEL